MCLLFPINDLHILWFLFSQDHKSRKSFVRSYITDLSKEAIMVDHKRNAMEKVWPQVLTEMVYAAVIEMWDTKAYMKSSLDELMVQKT